MNNSNQQQGQIDIELDEKTAEGVYSNLAIINHSSSDTSLLISCVSPRCGTPLA